MSNADPAAPSLQKAQRTPAAPPAEAVEAYRAATGHSNADAMRHLTALAAAGWTLAPPGRVVVPREAEFDAAAIDAAIYGTGFLMVRADGVERIDPANVRIEPEAPSPPWHTAP